MTILRNLLPLSAVPLLLLSACREANPPTDHHAALPHTAAAPGTDTALPTLHLERLATASGREVDTVSAAALTTALQQLETDLYVLQFWTLDCPECLQQNAVLEAVGVPTVYVNLDTADEQEQINAHIRAAGLTGQVYRLHPPNVPLPVLGGSVPPLPYFRVVDRVNAVEIDYHQFLSEGPLATMLTSLVGG